MTSFVQLWCITLEQLKLLPSVTTQCCIMYQSKSQLVLDNETGRQVLHSSLPNIRQQHIQCAEDFYLLAWHMINCLISTHHCNGYLNSRSNNKKPTIIANVQNIRTQTLKIEDCIWSMKSIGKRPQYGSQCARTVQQTLKLRTPNDLSSCLWNSFADTTFLSKNSTIQVLHCYQARTIPNEIFFVSWLESRTHALGPMGTLI